MAVASRIRAGLLAVAAAVAMPLLAAHRPGPLVTSPDDPTAGIVGAAAWVAWALAGYLIAAIGVSAVTHLASGSGGPGRLAALARRLTPRCVRRVIELAVGATAAAVVVAGAGPVAYADPPRPAAAVPAPLDWPGLSASAAPVALVSSPPRRHGGPRTEIVVRAGDSLWTLAARRLGPTASEAEIAAAWPRLYAANRAVIGTDPGLIHPGQRLVPPAADTRSPR
jgi:nucleoid-associated protein YgaU